VVVVVEEGSADTLAVVEETSSRDSADSTDVDSRDSALGGDSEAVEFVVLTVVVVTSGSEKIPQTHSRFSLDLIKTRLNYLQAYSRGNWLGV